MKRLLCAALLLLPTGAAAHGVDAKADLLGEPHGYAAGTTGGLHGPVYMVTTTEDYGRGEPAVPGSLRAAVEGKTPVWVRFDPAVFAPERGTEIVLKRPLRLPSDITVEGTGAKVTLVHVADWNKYDPVRIAGREDYTCARKPGVASSAFFEVLNQRNIILSHLIYQRREINPPAVEVYDKECLGDVILLANQQMDHGFDRIWINASTFGSCGDGCIDMTRPTAELGRVTVSNNRFEGSNKVMLVGSDTNAAGRPLAKPEMRRIRASVYGNAFLRTHQRQPKVNYALAHVYNNLYQGWVRYGALASEGARVVAEQNVFRAGRQKADGIRSDAEREVGERTGAVLAWSNLFAEGAEGFEERAPDRPSYLPDDPGPVANLRSLDPADAAKRVLDGAGWRYAEPRQVR